MASPNTANRQVQPSLFLKDIGRCYSCKKEVCTHPKLKSSNPVGSCEDWTDGNFFPCPFEVTVSANAYEVEDKDVPLRCTKDCRITKKSKYPRVFI